MATVKVFITLSFPKIKKVITQELLLTEGSIGFKTCNYVLDTAIMDYPIKVHVYEKTFDSSGESITDEVNFIIKTPTLTFGLRSGKFRDTINFKYSVIWSVVTWRSEHNLQISFHVFKSPERIRSEIKEIHELKLRLKNLGKEIIENNPPVQKILNQRNKLSTIKDDEIVLDCWKWTVDAGDKSSETHWEAFYRNLAQTIEQKFQVPKFYLSISKQDETPPRLGHPLRYHNIHRYDYCHDPDRKVTIFEASRAENQFYEHDIWVQFQHCTLPIIFVNQFNAKFLYAVEKAALRGHIIQWAVPHEEHFHLFLDNELITPHYLIESRRFKYFCIHQDACNSPQYQRAIATWCEIASKIEAHLSGKAWQILVIPENSIDIRTVCENL